MIFYEIRKKAPNLKESPLPTGLAICHTEFDLPLFPTCEYAMPELQNQHHGLSPSTLHLVRFLSVTALILGGLGFAMPACVYAVYKLLVGSYSIYVTGFLLFLCIAVSLGLILFFSQLLIYGTAYLSRVTLRKALRLSEAMHLFGVQTHREAIAAIRFYGLDVYYAGGGVPEGGGENIPCRKDPTFNMYHLSPHRAHVALGSPYFCCDYAQVQEALDTARRRWNKEAGINDKSAEVIALERKLADLHSQLKELKEKYTATAGREGKLKKRQENAEAHMAVLVELASEVTREITPPHTITKDQLQKRYKKLADQHGLSDIPAAYLKLFREHMPEELINRGGAPRQS